MQINRVFNDFNRGIFGRCVEYVSSIVDCDFIFTDIFDISEDLKNAKIHSEHVMLYVGDQMYMDKPVHPINKMSVVELAIYDFVIENPQLKKVLLFNEHIPYNLPIASILPNVYLVHISDIVSDKEQYAEICPVTEKNFDSHKTLVSLNRNMRPHRVAMVAYLTHLKLCDNAYISAIMTDGMKSTELMDIIDWDFSSHVGFKEELLQGYKNIDYSSLMVDTDVYETVANTQSVIAYNNSVNFDMKLRRIYNDSFVELVSETLYDTETAVVSEKYLHSVYGCNFPIIISSPGTVHYFRSMGFDMFDDIINHAYDDITDPCERMVQCIKSNLNMLSDCALAKKEWQGAKDRFDKNIQFARTGMYEQYSSIALSMTKQIMENELV